MKFTTNWNSYIKDNSLVCKLFRKCNKKKKLSQSEISRFFYVTSNARINYKHSLHFWL